MSRILLAVVVLAFATSAKAHAPSTSYVGIESGPGKARIELKLDLRDVARVVDLDADRDGQVTWGELKRVHGPLTDYVQGRLELSVTGLTCPLASEDLKVDHLLGGTFAVLTFAAPCDARSLRLHYGLFFDVDADHRAILKVGGSSAGVMTKAAQNKILSLEPSNLRDVLREYIGQGIVHIWEGFDHLLFLMVLLIPAASAPSFRRALLETLKVVTAFTISHSLTLGLVTLGAFKLPLRLVEATIALSIVLTALSNLRPFLGGRAWVLAGGFGLIHGCGFASVLSDVGLKFGALIPSLIAFNVGVELGQALLVAVALPILYFVHESRFYRPVVYWGGSLCAAALAAVWMGERIFDFKILPF